MTAGSPSRGFTLIELVMVIMVVTIAVVGLVAALSRLGEATLVSERVQTAAELAQSCAEHLLASRRNQGFVAMTLSCATVPGFSGTVTVTAPFVNAACPDGTGNRCRRLQITATVPAGISATMELMVVNY